ncbi:bromodomain and WD repeat-containing 1 isoform X1 [Olea europaea subsp. europaea]|uniref:Bromodomain and WD repeat-containing 1 isoform X1 n=1 Tax=Olea europaea subsp. europaea TaxID=158383 RepID=A0A8S0U4C2_OLEEU|nr:bromodomain and WD repeat-containing 1 isoform X1 [Olea europaea subsp. europaea]
MNIFSFFSFLPFFFFVNIVSYTAFYVKRWLGYFFWYLFKEFYMAPPKKEKTPQTFREIYMLLIFRFNHDNIVTCSRDGSAIIWIPRSRRSHGKVGRWIRAYHLKVPPPPMPPQPPRGGPRQRILPTPRGVNMIAWSLDNRFVLAAIMDCRICVWNAVDGSLVHSLTGHTDSTYVLDVHPSNPRIAMSAGYDGKTIVWDIWEGTPIRTYEIGRFKLVDGKFSSDGTSIILSDDVGQLYILNTGQGESQKDAKFDQFFLGDYRPLIQDTHGNVLDQETQLAPYRRNMQDLLCDSSMIPYPEPYQSMYQQRRLGALGIEWRPSSTRFAVGVDFSMNDYQMLPIADLDILIDPLPEFVDAIDWEPEIEIHSDDNDSEYNVTEDYFSGGEQGSLSSNSGDPECSAEDSEVEESHRDHIRRSKRKKQKAEIMTSSGRRVKRKNLDEFDDNSFRNNINRKSRNGRKSSRKKSSLKSLRPQRAAARNALHLFSRITGTSTEEVDGFTGDSSGSESTLQDSSFESEESDISLQNEWHEHSKGKEISLDQSDDAGKPRSDTNSPSNAGSKRRLILKLPNRDFSKSKCDNHPALAGSSYSAPYKVDETNRSYCQDERYIPDDAEGDRKEGSKIGQPAKAEHHFDLLEGYKDSSIRWGGVKARTSKRLRIGEPLQSEIPAGTSSVLDEHMKTGIFNGYSMFGKENGAISPSSEFQNQEASADEIVNLNEHSYETMPERLEGAENVQTHLDECKDDDELPVQFNEVVDSTTMFAASAANGTHNHLELKDSESPIPTKLRIRSSTLSRDRESLGKIGFESPPEDFGKDASDTLCGSLNSQQNLELQVPDRNGIGELQSVIQEHDSVPESEALISLQDSLKLDSPKRMFTAVYRRSKSSRGRCNPEFDNGSIETSSNVPIHYDGAETANEGFRRARSIRLRLTARDIDVSSGDLKFKEAHDDSESLDVEKASVSKDEDSSCEEWGSGSRIAVRPRSTRNRKDSYYIRETSPPDRRKSYHSGRSSWLLLSTHEEGSRYIPQKGDEIVYLRQGHQEYMSYLNLKDMGPWKTIKGNIRAVEFCRVEDLEYSTHPGSGESCCKMTVKFVDPSSDVVGKSFKLTLPEVTEFPDFLVERSRYNAAVQRNWTSRDKCQVWWKNAGEEDGSWWEGRILTVKPKSLEFPDSPWERYVVKYKSEPTETHQHSPWELYDADTHWEQPHIEDDIKDKLLLALAKLEQSANKAQDYYGVSKLKQVAQKTNFINRFPVPLSLEVIHSRLENNYYRSLEAMKHDIEVMLSNAMSYFGRNAEVSAKMERLSNWFNRTLSSL